MTQSALKKSIIAIDDSEISRQIYRSVLGKYYHLELAENAEQAWHKIIQSQFDLVITDVNLPGISGLQLLRDAKKLPQYTHTPFIVVSGDQDGIADAKNICATYWLLKPVNPESLLKTVIKLLAED